MNSISEQKRGASVQITKSLRANTAFFWLAMMLLEQVSSVSAHASDCDLTPINFPGEKLQDSSGGFDKTGQMAKQLQDLKNAGLSPAGADISFGQPRVSDGYNNKITDMFLTMSFDATQLTKLWEEQVKAQGNQDGCSNSQVNTIGWAVLPDGSWQGNFHVKYVKRSCFWFFGNVQTDLVTLEIDFKNHLRLIVAPDGKTLTPLISSEESDNVPDWLKPIAQFLNNCLSIVTVGLVPVDKHVIDAYKNIDQILVQMNHFNVLPQVGTASATLDNITYETVFDSANFVQSGGTLILTVKAKTAPSSLLSRGQACVVHDSFLQLRAQSDIPPGGLDYEIKKGDTAWNIANQFYGNGRYFPIVTGINDIPHASSDQMAVGKKMNIQRISTLLNRDDVLITLHGDSLWKMAHPKGGTAPSYSGLLAQNKGWIEDPNMIYPVEFIKIAPSDRKNAAK